MNREREREREREMKEIFVRNNTNIFLELINFNHIHLFSIQIISNALCLSVYALKLKCYTCI